VVATARELAVLCWQLIIKDEAYAKAAGYWGPGRCQGRSSSGSH
jgi:hypothetical protein